MTGVFLLILGVFWLGDANFRNTWTGLADKALVNNHIPNVQGMLKLNTVKYSTSTLRRTRRTEYVSVHVLVQHLRKPLQTFKLLLCVYTVNYSRLNFILSQVLEPFQASMGLAGHLAMSTNLNQLFVPDLRNLVSPPSQVWRSLSL